MDQPQQQSKSDHNSVMDVDGRVDTSENGPPTLEKQDDLEANHCVPQENDSENQVARSENQRLTQDNVNDGDIERADNEQATSAKGGEVESNPNIAKAASNSSDPLENGTDDSNRRSASDVANNLKRSTPSRENDSSSDTPRRNDDSDSDDLPPLRRRMRTEDDEDDDTAVDDDSNDRRKWDDSDSSDEESYLKYDPSPNAAYPVPNWFSIPMLRAREYGLGMNIPNSKTMFKPQPILHNPHSFRKHAFESVYFVQRLEMMGKLENHTGCVNCLNFSPSGDLLCSGSDDLSICIWDWQRKKLKQDYNSGHTSNVFQSKWCLDGNSIISCARDGQVRLAHLNGSGVSVSTKRIALHRAPAHKLTLTSPHTILSCGEDGLVYEMDLRLEKPSSKLCVVKKQGTSGREVRVPLYSIHSNMLFSPYHFAVSGRDPIIRVYDRRQLPSTQGNPTAPLMQLCPEHLTEAKHNVTCCQYSPSGGLILGSYNDEDMYTFDTKTGQKVQVYQGHRNNATVKGCGWFGDNVVLSGSDDGYVYGWDTQSGHILVHLFADDGGVVNCMEPHPTSPFLATSGLDDDIKIWSPTAREWPSAIQKGVKRRICNNMRDRKREHRRLEEDGMADMMDASMVWLIIRHMRQRHRNGPSAGQADDDDTDMDDDDNDDEDEEANADEDEDDDAGPSRGRGPRRRDVTRCIQS